MGKHTINFSYNRLTVDLGDITFYLRHDSKLESISVDCKRDRTTICLSGMHNKAVSVCMFSVNDYSFNELAELILDLVRIKRPEKLYLEKFGMSVGISDYLIPKLKENKIVLSKSGILVYDVSDEYSIR